MSEPFTANMDRLRQEWDAMRTPYERLWHAVVVAELDRIALDVEAEIMELTDRDREWLATAPSTPAPPSAR